MTVKLGAVLAMGIIIGVVAGAIGLYIVVRHYLDDV